MRSLLLTLRLTCVELVKRLATAGAFSYLIGRGKQLMTLSQTSLLPSSVAISRAGRHAGGNELLNTIGCWILKMSWATKQSLPAYIFVVREMLKYNAVQCNSVIRFNPAF